MKNKYALLALAPACLLPSFTALSAPTSERPASPVKTALVEEASVASRYFVPGTVLAAEDARLAAEISGKLEWVAEPGTEVRRGDVVARIDASRLAAERDRQAAEVRRLEAMVRLRKQNLTRQSRLKTRGVAVGVEVDQAEAELSMAEQDLAGAQAALQRTTEDVRRTKLKAPFDGQIVERIAQRGEYPREGTPVVRLVAVRRLEVWADAPISAASQLQPGLELPVRAGGKLIPATLAAIIQTGSAARRIASLRLTPHPEAVLSIGAAVEVGIPGRRAEKQTVVPRDALVLREDGAHVMIVNEEKKVHKVPVEVGLGEGDHIAVIGKLRPGQTVVRRGAENLSEGDAVKIIDADSRAPTDEG
ncbi:MAG: efflux RND transporter periplasmic adaptor subunit [Myxococcota bacterium]